jgi:5-methylcytosine-specific restriction endonuclease McrBC regulatory subunit McrC
MCPLLWSDPLFRRVRRRPTWLFRRDRALAASADARSPHVEPRRFNSNGIEFRIDYLALYAACAADPEVSSRLDQCLTVYSDEAPVEAPAGADWSPLIALAYLRVLHDLVQRHLRRGFVSREEDLHDRIRGQVAFGRYAARSLARGHPEIVPCRFQALDQDTPENRILRTALVGACRLLDGAAGQGLSSPASAWRVWSRQADAALAGAAIARIPPRDFRTARKAGAYRHYARSLALAQAVLTRTGFDPNQPAPQAVARLVPFRLSTCELFERYLEVCLRRLGRNCVWGGHHDQNLGCEFRVRPDFLLRSARGGVILDAKYKNLSDQSPRNSDDQNSLRGDVYQTLAYSTHTKVRAELTKLGAGVWIGVE